MGDYTTIAAVRELEGMLDSSAFPDAAITAAIDEVEPAIDDHTGTSWVHKAFTVTLDGNNHAAIVAKRDDGSRITYPRSVVSATIDDVAVADVSGWKVRPEGVIWADNATFVYTIPGRNISITGTAGYTSAAPPDIARAAGLWARQILIDGLSRVEGRALTLQNDYGLVRLAQPGRQYPTGVPAIDTIIDNNSHKGATVG